MEFLPRNGRLDSLLASASLLLFMEGAEVRRNTDFLIAITLFWSNFYDIRVVKNLDLLSKDWEGDKEERTPFLPLQ